MADPPSPVNNSADSQSEKDPNGRTSASEREQFNQAMDAAAKQGIKTAPDQFARAARIWKQQQETEERLKKLNNREERIKVPSLQHDPSKSLPVTPEPGSILDGVSKLAKWGNSFVEALAKAPAKPTEQPDLSNSLHQAEVGTTPSRMAKLFGWVRRSRMVALETGHYLMGWNPVGILIGLFGAGGAFVLTLALNPESYSSSLYRLAEILFAVSILLFIAKCIYDFRAHKERRLIAKGLGVLGVFILIGVIGLFEWNRPTKTSTAELPSAIPAASPLPGPTHTPQSAVVQPVTPFSPAPSRSATPRRKPSPKTAEQRKREQAIRDLHSQDP